MSREISPAAQRYIDAVNAFDVDAVVSTFASDALVNDNHREFADRDSIRAWVAAEIVADHVTMEVTDAIERSGITVLRARYDGDYNKSNLPDELILTNYIIIRDDLITALFIIFNNT
jgi:hypothetical protein